MKFYTLNVYQNSTVDIDIFNATHDVRRALRESGILNGLLTVFLPGATACVSVIENDPKLHGALKDLIKSFVLDTKGVRPSRRSGSGREDAHLRAALLSNSICIPIKDGRLLMGAWQEVIVFDFDDKVGRREIFIHVMGEGEEEKKKK